MPIEVQSIQTLERPLSDFVGWPTIAKGKSGDLFIVYSGGRSHHVCPFGQIHMIRSGDQGQTWTWPRTLADGPLDDRDTGILSTAKGTLIVNWFSSLTWEWMLEEKPEQVKKTIGEKERAEWERRRKWLTNDVRARELGVWSIRSTDNGHTWSSKIDTVTGSSHGPLQLSDGRLLHLGKRRTPPGQLGTKGGPYTSSIGASISLDDGQSWKLHSEIEPMAGHNSSEYHELHGVQAGDGRVVVHIRNHNEKHQYEVLQTESTDSGKTWGAVHPTGLWGYPAFLLRTADGRLITTLGHRREPMGNQIAVSEDHGQSWSKQTPINTDSKGDLGYPATAELSANVFLTVWYDQQDRKGTCLRLAKWRLT
jgi:hypothetical protein